ncbi:MAG: hypothetical protein KDD40_09330, partial [Bdellovibrionales bacterium]|nr:hypothetical protein [Bdellovibrionales bacterium]
ASGLTAKERRMFLQLIASEKTFILPKQAFYYLSRASLNHCSHLAGFYIHQKMSGLEKKLWNMPKDFLPLIWHEAAAFFLSKIINHKRKSDSLLVIENNLRFADEKERGREAMALVLDQKTDEWIYVKSGRHKKNKLKVKKDISYVHAAKILGSIMGEKLYNSYSSGRMSRSLINKFLQKSLTANDFEAFYYLMVKRLEAQTVLNAKGARS